MDGCGNTSRMDTAYHTIKLHSGRLSGLFYTFRLIPHVSLDVQVILSSSERSVLELRNNDSNPTFFI